MSAEKEIVNFWYHQKGYFTLSTLKSKNRDVGIIALKFSKEGVKEALYIDVSCSLLGNISEQGNLKSAINLLVCEKFGNSAVRSVLDEKMKNLPVHEKDLQKIIVLGAMPKSKKKEIRESFLESGVEVVEFESVLESVMASLDTQYYKSDSIRTLQLIKYLFLSDPKKMASLLGGDLLNSQIKEEFLGLMMGSKEMMKGFRSIDSSSMGDILRHSKLKDPKVLAKVLDESVLNSKTRKPFVETIMNQKGSKKVLKEKKVMTLKKFMGE